MNGQDGKTLDTHPADWNGVDGTFHTTSTPSNWRPPFQKKWLQMRLHSHHRTLYVFTNYLWNRNILRDHRSPKIFSTEELPFIERRWVSVYQVHASLGSCKKHLENFPQYVWNKGITWIYFSYKRGGILCLPPPPFKMGNKFCLVRKRCKIPLNLKK